MECFEKKKNYLYSRIHLLYDLTKVLREYVPTILSVCGALFPDHSYMVLTIELSLKLYGKIIQTRI